MLSLGLTLGEKFVQGWLWLSGEMEAPKDKVFCLRQVLALEPDNEFAMQELAWLNGEVEYPEARAARPRVPDPLSEIQLVPQVLAWPHSEAESTEDRELRLERLSNRITTPDDLSDAELLIREGIETADAGYHARARHLLSLGLTMDEGNVRGWLKLSNEVKDLEDKRFCLQQVLKLEPGNESALRDMDSLRQQTQLEEQAQRLSNLRKVVSAEPAPEGMVEAKTLAAPAPDRPGIVPESVWTTAGASVASTVEARPGGKAQRVRARPVEEAREASAAWIELVIRSEFTFIAVLGLVLLALIARGVGGLPAPLPLLRLVLGLAFVLLVPGYAMQAALFPRGDALDGTERLALSFGLSVSVVPPLALLLDWLPWGISLWPIIAIEGLVTALLSAIALIRRWRLPIEQRPLLVVNLGLKDWWASQDRTGRVLYGVAAGALLLALLSATAIIVLPKPSDRFTEFYLLGPDGLAENYPREAVPGQELSVTAGIANREGQMAEYRVDVQVEGETIGAAGPVMLGDGEVWEASLAYALPRVGDDQQVEFLLYRDGGQVPYHRLRLWINVVEALGDHDE